MTSPPSAGGRSAASTAVMRPSATWTHPGLRRRSARTMVPFQKIRSVMVALLSLRQVLIHQGADARRAGPTTTPGRFRPGDDAASGWATRPPTPHTPPVDSRSAPRRLAPVHRGEGRSRAVARLIPEARSSTYRISRMLTGYRYSTPLLAFWQAMIDITKP